MKRYRCLLAGPRLAVEMKEKLSERKEKKKGDGGAATERPKQRHITTATCFRLKCRYEKKVQRKKQGKGRKKNSHE